MNEALIWTKWRQDYRHDKTKATKQLTEKLKGRLSMQKIADWLIEAMAETQNNFSVEKREYGEILRTSESKITKALDHLHYNRAGEAQITLLRLKDLIKKEREKYPE